MCSKILYKYYGFNAGIAALKSQNLGFREPQYFNDPFELSYLNVSYPELTEDITDFSQLRRPDLKGKGIRERIGILSLSQTEKDPLMWAHYGDEHKGFCIGYDVDNEFLNSKEFNLIPISDGTVEYKKTKETLDGEKYKDALCAVHDLATGMVTSRCDIEAELIPAIDDILKKWILHKHQSWHYEKEVRVVKIIDPWSVESATWQLHPYRSFRPFTTQFAPMHQITNISGLSIFNHKVRIKEVYLGMRNPLLDPENLKDESKDDLAKTAINEDWKIHAAQLPERGSWEIKFNPVSEDILIENQPCGLKNKFGFSGLEAIAIKNYLSDTQINARDNFEFTHVGNHLNIKKNGGFI